MSTEGSRLHRAASSALLPRTDWRYWVVKYAEPIIPKADTVLRTSAGVKPCPRKRAGGIIGEAEVRWRRTNSAANSRPTVIETTWPTFQPRAASSFTP